MKKLIYCLALGALLLLLAACESGGKFRVVNQTYYPLYVTLEGESEVTIPGNSEQTFDVDTATEHIFNPDVEEEIKLRMVGETYQIWDDVEEAYTDSTTVTIKAGETLSAYITANCASFKVVNNSSLGVQKIELYKHNFIAAQYMGDLGALAPGQSRFLRVGYVTPNNYFYYYAILTMADEDDTEYTFGGETTVLNNDEQFLITLTDPD